MKSAAASASPTPLENWKTKVVKNEGRRLGRYRRRQRSGLNASSSYFSSYFSSSSSAPSFPFVLTDDDEDGGLERGRTVCEFDEEGTKCLLTACFAKRCRTEWQEKKDGSDEVAFEHTVDFGVSMSAIRIDSTHVEIRRNGDDDNAIALRREDVFDIEPDDLTVYRVVRPWTIDSEKPSEPVLEPCRMYSNTIERVCALCPSDDTNPDLPPTALIAGFSMHRFGLGVDPKEDTRRKIASLKPYRGNDCSVLDICTGLAYTAIMASELENVSSVTTIELDPTMTQICAMNPHSKGLFRSSSDAEDNIITQLYGNAFDVIQTLPDYAFDRIIHDPPTFALAGELYGENFYSELFRVLKPSGRVYHYTGDPSANVTGGGGVRGIVKRMKMVGFETVAIDQHAHGVVAAKQANVKFFSSGKKDKKTKNARGPRDKTRGNRGKDGRKRGSTKRWEGDRGRNTFDVRGYDDDDESESEYY